MFPLFCGILLSSIGNTEGDSVLQNHSIFLQENEKAVLYCQYETSYSAPDLFWYIQSDKKSPEFILNSYNTRGNGYKEGLTADHEKSNKTYNLKIAAAVLSDSATYYCALRPTLCDSFEDSIMAINNTVHALGESNVALSCTYSSTASAKYLHWYRQYPSSKPEFLVLVVDASGTEPKKRAGRFYAKVDKENSRVDLEISSAEVTDSALYYCALQPTVTGNPFTLYKNLTLTCTRCNIKTLQHMQT
ncbi:uncharacterized protein LOC118229625 [Anguilla anguilla]|uniref:uncharacterized protein LOC118229625 n=1 Tax=Anguilla anguilla TaxID=7936 RepID=UPI0015A7F89D|nr:uncharacterized protein LOC118229625 [Anguilla anguilla]